MKGSRRPARVRPPGLGYALYLHARRVRSAILGDAYRVDDLAHHLRLRDRLDRAGRAITGR